MLPEIMLSERMLPEPFNSAPESALREIHLKDGELLFRARQRTRGLYYLADGKLEMRRYTPAGDTVVVHRAGAREMFAEASVFSGEYHCDSVAVEDSRCIEMDRGYLLDTLATNPDFAVKLVRQFAMQMQACRRKLEILAIRKADERVLAAVLDGWLATDIKTLAAEIGLAHEVVYRSLAKLVAEGKIEKRGRGRYGVPGDHEP